MWPRKSTPALPAVAIRPSIAAFPTDRPRERSNAEVISAPAPFARTYLLDMIDGCLSAQLLNAVCIRRPSLILPRRSSDHGMFKCRSYIMGSMLPISRDLPYSRTHQVS